MGYSPEGCPKPLSNTLQNTRTQTEALQTWGNITDYSGNSTDYTPPRAAPNHSETHYRTHEHRQKHYKHGGTSLIIVGTALIILPRGLPQTTLKHTTEHTNTDRSITNMGEHH